MDTRTGEIGNLDELLKKAFSPDDVVPLGNKPDPNCPRCQGTGRDGKRDYDGKWIPCACTNPGGLTERMIRGHTKKFHKMNKKGGK